MTFFFVARYLEDLFPSYQNSNYFYHYEKNDPMLQRNTYHNTYHIGDSRLVLELDKLKNPCGFCQETECQPYKREQLEN